MLFLELESGLLKTKTCVFTAVPAAFLPKMGVFSLSEPLPAASLLDLPLFMLLPSAERDLQGGGRG